MNLQKELFKIATEIGEENNHLYDDFDNHYRFPIRLFSGFVIPKLLYQTDISLVRKIEKELNSLNGCFYKIILNGGGNKDAVVELGLGFLNPFFDKVVQMINDGEVFDTESQLKSEIINLLNKAFKGDSSLINQAFDIIKDWIIPVYDFTDLDLDNYAIWTDENGVRYWHDGTPIPQSAVALSFYPRNNSNLFIDKMKQSELEKISSKLNSIAAKYNLK